MPLYLPTNAKNNDAINTNKCSLLFFIDIGVLILVP